MTEDRLSQNSETDEMIIHIEAEEDNTSADIEVTNKQPAENASTDEQRPSDDESAPLDCWIAVNPPMRGSEVDFLIGENLGFPMTITDDGDLQQPFKCGAWIFLLILDKAFPRRTEYGAVPARVYLVSPSASELSAHLSTSLMASIRMERPGMDYLDFGVAGEEEYSQYIDGRSWTRMCGNMIYRATEWAEEAQKVIVERNRPVQARRGFQIPFFHKRRQDVDPYEVYSQQRPKYTEGRSEFGGIPHPRCNKVVLSDRAFIQIFNESRARIQTETGGLLLGHFDQGVWYVVEASDPGINAKFFGAYHEGDDVYENHVCGVISRTYKYPLVFLGMWHRHPGSLDSFSGTDDGTNFKYAGSAGNGCISAIVNYDPDFRITFYYVEQGGPARVLYTCVDIEVGNDKFIRPEMMQIASMQDVMGRR